MKALTVGDWIAIGFVIAVVLFVVCSVVLFWWKTNIVPRFGSGIEALEVETCRNCARYRVDCPIDPILPDPLDPCASVECVEHRRKAA